MLLSLFVHGPLHSGLFHRLVHFHFVSSVLIVVHLRLASMVRKPDLGNSILRFSLLNLHVLRNSTHGVMRLLILQALRLTHIIFVSI